MWIDAVAPERIAELFQNYQDALGGFGPKGSECASWKESPEAEKTRKKESREHFAEPSEADWAADSAV